MGRAASSKGLWLHNGRVVWPDFTILHPVTEEIFIWEHMGLMDEEEYRNRNLQKIVEYGKSGFLINNKLIVTMESRSLHIDAEEINAIVKRVFGE